MRELAKLSHEFFRQAEQHAKCRLKRLMTEQWRSIQNVVPKTMDSKGPNNLLALSAAEKVNPIRN